MKEIDARRMYAANIHLSSPWRRISGSCRTESVPSSHLSFSFVSSRIPLSLPWVVSVCPWSFVGRRCDSSSSPRASRPRLSWIRCSWNRLWSLEARPEVLKAPWTLCWNWTLSCRTNTTTDCSPPAQGSSETLDDSAWASPFAMAVGSLRSMWVSWVLGN